MYIMKFDNTFLDTLTEPAKHSPCLRMHYDLRDTTEDPCMRMLNALEPETVIIEFDNGKYDPKRWKFFSQFIVIIYLNNNLLWQILSVVYMDYGMNLYC